LTLGLPGTAILAGGAAAVGYVISIANSAPPLNTRRPINLGATSRLYAADGTRLGFIQADVLRTPVPSSELPQIVRDATIAVEDQRFYEHAGVDFEGVVRAAMKNLSSKGEIEGGSTLTMQLVRNLYTGERERTFKRKIREAKPAEELEDLHPVRRGKLWILTSTLTASRTGPSAGRLRSGSRRRPASSSTSRRRTSRSAKRRCWPAFRRRPRRRQSAARHAARRHRRRVLTGRLRVET
jgi:penicillin-binding protein 1A